MTDSAGAGRKSGIPFIDLQAQRERIREHLDDAIARVLEHGNFIMGPEVPELEERLAELCGCRHVVTCASGTDALLMALMAWEVGPDDAVFVPSFTFASTAEVVALLGAQVVFVDVDPDTFNLSPSSLQSAVAVAREAGLRPRVAIAVDMFGQPADYAGIRRVLEGESVRLLADAAQSFGASVGSAKVGTLGEVSTTSFFPAKPLGCYGDGGAIFTDDREVADVLRSIRVHGQGTNKYDNVRIGINGRLDTLQAAVLIEKLRIFEDEIISRQDVASIYNRLLGGVVKTPDVLKGRTSAWAQYTLRSGRRDDIAAGLRAEGIPTAIYYPKVLHEQLAYEHSLRVDDLSVSGRLATTVLSIPMHPYLNERTQEVVAEAIHATIGRDGRVPALDEDGGS